MNLMYALDGETAKSYIIKKSEPKGSQSIGIFRFSAYQHENW